MYKEKKQTEHCVTTPERIGLLEQISLDWNYKDTSSTK